MSTYASFVQSAMTDLAAVHPPGLNPDGKYSIPWILRARLLALIGVTSLKSLKVSKSDTLDLVKSAFPDAKDWLDLYSKGTSSVRGLVLELNYRHGVEVLTGFFCLFGDTEVLKHSVEYLSMHKDSLKRHLKTYVEEHGVNPHPAILLKEFANTIGQTKRPAAAAQPDGLIKRPAAQPDGPSKRCRTQ